MDQLGALGELYVLGRELPVLRWDVASANKASRPTKAPLEEAHLGLIDDRQARLSRRALRIRIAMRASSAVKWSMSLEVAAVRSELTFRRIHRDIRRSAAVRRVSFASSGYRVSAYVSGEVQLHATERPSLPATRGLVFGVATI